MSLYCIEATIITALCRCPFKYTYLYVNEWVFFLYFNALSHTKLRQKKRKKRRNLVLRRYVPQFPDFFEVLLVERRNSTLRTKRNSNSWLETNFRYQYIIPDYFLLYLKYLNDFKDQQKNLTCSYYNALRFTRLRKFGFHTKTYYVNF